MKLKRTKDTPIYNFISQEEISNQVGYRNGGKYLYSSMKDNLAFVELVDTDTNRIYYVCEAVMVWGDGNTGPTWQSLKDLGLMEGKEIIIKGLRYRCFIPTGGNTLPLATQLGGEYSEIYEATTRSGSGGFISFGDNCYTICRDKWGDSSHALVRKYDKSYLNIEINTPRTDVGWRPVLELLDYPPQVSVEGKDLGDITSFTDIPFEILDKNENETFNIIVKINGQEYSNKLNQLPIGNKLSISDEKWDELNYGSNIIELQVIDPTNQKVSVLFTFFKIKQNITIPTLQNTLKQQIVLNTDIHEELKNQVSLLRRELKTKEIETTSSQGLSSLIQKIKDIKTYPKWIGGDTWVNTHRPMPTPRYLATASCVKDKIYVIGGFTNDSSQTSINECLDINTNKWTTKAPMPVSCNGLFSHAIGDIIYVFPNGFSSIYCYNTLTDTWTTKSGKLRYHSASCVVGTKIFVIGGNNGSSYTYKDILCYDTETDLWTTRSTTLPADVSWGKADVLNNKIYIAGMSNFYCYDFNSETIITRADHSTGRIEYFHQIDGKFYTVIQTLENNNCYNPDTNGWYAKRKDFPESRSQIASCVHDGVIYTFGGVGSSSPNNCGQIVSCYIP